jgi:hypothetical protein
MRYIILVFLVLLPVTTFAEVKQETRDLELPAVGINILRIQCGAGSLILRGVEGIDKIEVSADIMVQGLQPENLESYFENNVLLALQSFYDPLVSNRSKPKSTFWFEFPGI